MAKKKGKTNKGSKKKTEPEKLAVRESPKLRTQDMLRSFDEEIETFRRNLERSLWWPQSRIGSTLLAWPEYYWPKLEWTDIKSPLMDIKDTGRELIIEAEMPRIPKENIDIQLTGNSIEICGELKTKEKEEDEGYYRQERSYTTCFRQVPLPGEAIPGKADATLEDGILHIKIPKKKSTPREKVHSVKVK
ncbi:MAG: Hsp20/alpha crystallin family protein [Thermoplasmata archaeon]|nr:MAG: Hsp20/alpha crystallin family protein [Thermoplasmata archaeon]